MLSDSRCQLLTAFVDGELDARQRQAVERLVKQSPEARSFLARLEKDSNELKGLPRRKAPDTLPDGVMKTISELTPRPRLPA